MFLMKFLCSKLADIFLRANINVSSGRRLMKREKLNDIAKLKLDAT